MPEVRREEVRRRYEEMKPIETQYIVGRQFGLSSSMVGKIVRSYREKDKPVTVYIPGWYRFLPHYVWAVDTQMFWWKSVWIYFTVMIEENTGLKLGWELSLSPTAEVSQEVLGMAWQRAGYLPLVLKHDNGKQFLAKRFQDVLIGKQVLSLASPAYWPTYNARVEWSFRKVRKVYVRIEAESWTELVRELDGWMNYLNTGIPLMKFEGKTAAEVFRQFNPPEEVVRQRIYAKATRVHQQWVENFGQKGRLQVKRKIFESVLVKEGLCQFRRGYFVNQFQDQSVQ